MKSSSEHARRLFEESSARRHCKTDQLFAGLLSLQLLAGLSAAVVISLRASSDASLQAQWPAWVVMLLGASTCIVPLGFVILRPGEVLTRHVIAAAQALTSALLIHCSGGRIEAHFHIFGVLAILALYRDWRVLITAASVVGLGHFVRAAYWPESVFGVLNLNPWRWLEHLGWMAFELVFLIHSCVLGRKEMISIAESQACMEENQGVVESEVIERTSELRIANKQLQKEHADRSQAEEERDLLNIKLSQTQKLESIGQLAAGIAHEINTPIQFVGDNMHFLKACFGDLSPILVMAEDLANKAQAVDGLAPGANLLLEAMQAADMQYLSGEIPRAIEQTLGGIDRVRSIVQSMKEFSHPGFNEMTNVDINRAIESTITVASNEWKYCANMETDFAPNLPPVPCFPGELNQVILNLIVNGSHAIIESCAEGQKGTLRIQTKLRAQSVEIRVSDSGAGIPEHVRDRIFDPFFTTKEVGKGTGQGLAMAHMVIVKKHSGTIGFETKVGVGTCFVISLPLVQAAASALAEEAA